MRRKEALTVRWLALLLLLCLPSFADTAPALPEKSETFEGELNPSNPTLEVQSPSGSVTYWLVFLDAALEAKVPSSSKPYHAKVTGFTRNGGRWKYILVESITYLD